MRLAGTARLRRVPLLSAEADRRLGEMPLEQRLSRAWLVGPDGRRWGGAEAIWHALYLVPLLGPMLRPLRLIPGFRPLSDRIYEWVAAQRYNRGCRLDRPRPRGE